MKKTSKIIAIIAILSLAVTALSACSITFGDNTPTNTTKEPDTVVSTEATTTTKVTEATTEESKIADIDQLLKSIKNFPLGTAGSTAKGVNIALDLINYAEFSTDSDKDIKAAYNAMRAEMNDEDKDVFDENLAEIEYFADELLKGGKVKDYINNPDDYHEGEYSKDKYDSLIELIS